jgi:hypothetical protein
LPRGRQRGAARNRITHSCAWIPFDRPQARLHDHGFRSTSQSRATDTPNQTGRRASAADNACSGAVCHKCLQLSVLQFRGSSLHKKEWEIRRIESRNQVLLLGQRGYRKAKKSRCVELRRARKLPASSTRSGVAIERPFPKCVGE